MDTVEKSHLSPEVLQRLFESTVAEVMGRWGDASARTELKAWLHGTARTGNEPGSAICGTAFSILYQTATDDERAELLTQGLYHPLYDVRLEAIWSALASGDSSLYPRFAELLSDRSDDVQRAAREALLRVQPPDPTVGSIIVDTILSPGTDLPPSDHDATVTLTGKSIKEMASIVEDLDQEKRDHEKRDLNYKDRARFYAIEAVMWPNKITRLGNALVDVIERAAKSIETDRAEGVKNKLAVDKSDEKKQVKKPNPGDYAKLACIALQYVEDKEQAARLVVERLVSQKGSFVTWGINALGYLGVADSIPTLVHYLDKGDLTQRRAAVSALGRMTDSSARAAVAKIWQSLLAGQQ